LELGSDLGEVVFLRPGFRGPVSGGGRLVRGLGLAHGFYFLSADALPACYVGAGEPDGGGTAGGGIHSTAKTVGGGGMRRASGAQCALGSHPDRYAGGPVCAGWRIPAAQTQIGGTNALPARA